MSRPEAQKPADKSKKCAFDQNCRLVHFLLSTVIFRLAANTPPSPSPCQPLKFIIVHKIAELSWSSTDIYPCPKYTPVIYRTETCLTYCVWLRYAGQMNDWNMTEICLTYVYVWPRYAWQIKGVKLKTFLLKCCVPFISASVHWNCKILLSTPTPLNKWT